MSKDSPSIVWLHLSDLHLCAVKTGWDVLSLLNDLKFMEAEYGLLPQLLFLTGDAAYGDLGSGSLSLAANYLEVDKLLTEVRVAFTQKIEKNNVFIVPSYHNVDQTIAIESENQHLLENDSNYHIREINNVKLAIAGVNSNWKNGNLIGNLKADNLKIALIHDTLDCLAGLDAQTRIGFSRNFDFFLHGHEHLGWLNADQFGHINIAAETYKNSQQKYGYNFTRLNFETGMVEVWLRQYVGSVWKPRIITNKTDANGCLLIDANFRLNNTQFKIVDDTFSNPIYFKHSRFPIKTTNTLPCYIQNISKLKLSNFKLFVEQEFNFHQQFNLIVGINASGKTSLLEAVSISLAAWTYGMIKGEKNHRAIELQEFREIQIDNRFDKTKRVEIAAEGKVTTVDNQQNFSLSQASWSRWCSDKYKHTQISGEVNQDNDNNHTIIFDQLGADTLQHIETGLGVTLPIIAYYATDRLWSENQPTSPEQAATLRVSRFDAYLDCLHITAAHSEINTWLLKHQLISLEQGQTSPGLLALQLAAKSALEYCSDMRFDFAASRVVLAFSTGETIPLEHLSDGQRTVLGLFCDIARRASVLNPHLSGEDILKIPGVVLIDELDLHLHPKWQRRIIEDLRCTFPNVQFICTSHSPFLIQSLRSGEELMMLEGSPTAHLGQLTIEEIAQGIMGVSQP